MSDPADNELITRRLEMARCEISGLDRPVTARDVLVYSGWIKSWLANPDEYGARARAAVTHELLRVGADHQLQEPPLNAGLYLPAQERRQIAVEMLESLLTDQAYVEEADAGALGRIEFALDCLREAAPPE